MVQELAVHMAEISAQDCLAIGLDRDRIDYPIRPRCSIESGERMAGIVRVPFPIQRAGRGIIIHNGDRSKLVEAYYVRVCGAGEENEKLFIELRPVIVGDIDGHCPSALAGGKAHVELSG